MTDDIEEALDALDRKASLGMAYGTEIQVDPMVIRKMVKASRGLYSAKVNYRLAAERFGEAERWTYQWGLVIVVASAILYRFAKALGII